MIDTSHQDDERFMAAALALGRRSLGRTWPNPSVGALVVKDGIVLGRGVTADGGRPHAETIALAQAGAAARGATIYVTLEPCSHHGKTGPCCEAIVAAGVARLVTAIEDPSPLARQGAAYCRAHGLSVTVGVCEEAARRDHRGHISQVTRKRPAVMLKLAETADGYVAGSQHDPRLAITGAPANGAVHVFRAMHDAIMVGVGTILADDPLMTVRLPGVDARPLRIVLDAMARTPPHARLVQTADDAPVLIVTTEAASQDRVAALAGVRGVEIISAEAQADGRLDLAAVLHRLGDRVGRVFSEGGPTVAGALIDRGLVDDVVILTAPRPLGRVGVPTLAPSSRAVLDDRARFRMVETRMIGVDRLRHYESLA